MITTKEYTLRRHRLAQSLPTDSIAVIPAASDMLRNADTTYRFRQDSDFYYLTGFNEPDALLVITAGKSGQSILFNLPPDPLHEQWIGQRLGQEDACSVLGVDVAYPTSCFDQQFVELLANTHAIYYAFGRFPAWEARILNAWQTVKKQVRRGINAPDMFCDLAPILSEMRLIKSDAEITLMRQSICR